MKAITYSAFGAAEDVLVLRDLDTPSPQPGEVLVRLKTSGANPSDVKARAGARPGVTEPPYPVIIPHSDGAGVIEAVGEGVDNGRIGERVWIWNGQWQRAFGTAAEYIALPQEQAVRLPEGTSFERGATLGIPGLTACHSVLGSGPVAGKRVLLSGGAGTVGRIAIQIAKASGTEVIATAHGEDGFEACRTAGADHVLDYRSETLAADILDVTGGELVERVVEVEFGKNINTITEVIAPNGTIATFGSMIDPTPAIPFYPLMFKAITIDLVLIYSLEAEARAKAIENLTSLLEAEKLDIRISGTYALAECAKVHDMIADGTRAGSVILTM